MDDNFVNRKLIMEIFRDKAECDLAANGVEAIEAYNLSNRNNTPYDAILLDIAMPGMDGVEVLKLIRDNEGKVGIPLGRGVPIIMVTAHKQPFVDSFKEGCDDYVLRPIDARELMDKIKKAMGKKNKGK